MAATARKRKVDSWKSKSWYNIIAPKVFGEVVVGKTLSADPSNLIGRTTYTTMRDITGNFSKQHIKLKLQIYDVKGDNAYTRLKGQCLSRDYMRSQIRRKTTRIEGVVDTKTKDGAEIRVKTIALAVGRAQTAQEKMIRKLMSKRISETASKQSLDQFMQDVVQGKISTIMYREASKIFPLKRVEVRKVRIFESG